MKNKPELKVNKEGTKQWFLNGKLHRDDGPAIEYINGHKKWWLNGKIHRIDGPAVEYSNGSKLWYLNDKLHRINGPACEYSNGEKWWYLNGKEVKEEDVINYNITEKQYLKFIMSL